MPDDWLVEMLKIAPQLGVAALLTGILFKVWASYERALDAARKRYSEDVRLLREEISRLRAQIAEMDDHLSRRRRDE